MSFFIGVTTGNLEYIYQTKAQTTTQASLAETNDQDSVWADYKILSAYNFKDGYYVSLESKYIHIYILLWGLDCIQAHLIFHA